MLPNYSMRFGSIICGLFFVFACFLLAACGNSDLCNSVECQNGGKCNDGSCQCPEGYMGQYCQYQKCDGAFCQNGGSCLDNLCQCPTGYSGQYCQYASCAVLQCPTGATCEENAQGIGECLCTFGYVGNDCSQQIREAFYGFYFVTDGCTDGHLGNNMNIGADPFGVLNLVITSNTNQGVFAFVAQVTSEESFVIPLQQLNSTTLLKGLGDGTLDPETQKITFSYAILNQAQIPIANCSVTLTKGG